MVQSLIPAIYPLLKDSFHLDFSQIGLITLTYQITASLLQPLIGHFNDRHPRPVFARNRHGLHADRTGVAFQGGNLSHAALRRGVGGHRARQCFIPSPLAWCAWFRADNTASPRRSFSGRQRRIVARSAIVRLSSSCPTVKQPGMVFGGGAARHHRPGPRGFLVEEKPVRQLKNPGPARPKSSDVDTAQGLLIADGVDRPDVFEVLLSFESEQLLHVLSDE